MPKLIITHGDDKIRGFSDPHGVEGTLVSFLTSPFHPCVVRTLLSKDPIGLNKGNLWGKFVSYFWDSSAAGMQAVYVVEYMADENVVLQMSKSFIPIPRKLEKYASQNGFCELHYSGNITDIKSEFLGAGFAFEENPPPNRWNEIQAQRDANIEKMAAELAEFYGNKN